MGVQWNWHIYIICLYRKKLTTKIIAVGQQCETKCFQLVIFYELKKNDKRLALHLDT